MTELTELPLKLLKRVSSIVEKGSELIAIIFQIRTDCFCKLVIDLSNFFNYAKGFVKFLVFL